MIDWLYTIKNKHLCRVAALAVMVAMTTWAWLVLRPLGYSYMQVFFGWLVFGLAADRVRIYWQDWRQQRFYKTHTQ